MKNFAEMKLSPLGVARPMMMLMAPWPAGIDAGGGGAQRLSLWLRSIKGIEI